MPISRLKTLIILILLVACGFLLALVIPGRLAQSQQLRSQHEQLIALFSSHGIWLSEDVLPQEQNLYVLELPDAQFSAEKLAKELFRTPVSLQYESTRDTCSISGENGTLTYDSTGLLHVTLKDTSETGSLRTGAEKYLKGLEYDTQSVSEPERLSAGVFCVSCTQSLFEVPVFSEPLRLTYTNNCLTEMDGSYFGGEKEAVRIDNTLCISCSDALVALLSERDSIGWVGSSILSVRQGYRHVDTASSAIRLAPCWEIVTDGGAFYVSGVAGEAVSIEAA